MSDEKNDPREEDPPATPPVTQPSYNRNDLDGAKRLQQRIFEELSKITKRRRK